MKEARGRGGRHLLFVHRILIPLTVPVKLPPSSYIRELLLLGPQHPGTVQCSPGKNRKPDIRTQDPADIRKEDAVA